MNGQGFHFALQSPECDESSMVANEPHPEGQCIPLGSGVCGGCANCTYLGGAGVWAVVIFCLGLSCIFGYPCKENEQELSLAPGGCLL